MTTAKTPMNNKVYDRLIALGLSPSQATRPATNWPLEAVEAEIARVRADPKVRNFVAVLAKVLNGDPPTVAPDSQRGGVGASGGSTKAEGMPGHYRACPWSQNRRDAATRALLCLERDDRAAFERFFMQVAPMIPCQRDAAVLNELTVFASFGPVLNLAHDFGVIRLDEDTTQKTEAAA